MDDFKSSIGCCETIGGIGVTGHINSRNEDREVEDNVGQIFRVRYK